MFMVFLQIFFCVSMCHSWDYVFCDNATHALPNDISFKMENPGTSKLCWPKLGNLKTNFKFERFSF